MSDGMIDCNVGWISMKVAGCTWTVVSDGTKNCDVWMHMDCDGTMDCDEGGWMHMDCNVGWYDGLRCWMI